MDIEDIRLLDRTSQALKKIDSYLSVVEKYSNEYYETLKLKCLCLHEIGRTNEALKILYSLATNLSEYQDQAAIFICDGIIQISFDIKNREQAKKYIDIKSKYLKAKDSKIHIYDLVKYYKLIDDTFEYKKYLIQYSNEDLNELERYKCNIELADLYIFDHDYGKFFDLCGMIESYCEKNFMFDEIVELNLKKINIFIECGNYPKAIIELKNLLEEGQLTNDKKLYIASLLMKSYIASSDYKKAIICESNYEEYISKTSPEIALAFCNTAIDLYEHIGHRVSISLYRSKINSLQSQINLNKKDELKKKKTAPKVVFEDDKELTNENVEANLKTKEIIYSSKDSIVEVVKKNCKNIYVSELYEKLNLFLGKINLLNTNCVFRECLRVSAEDLTMMLNIEEVILLYYQKNYYGFHYKKERVYDKYFDFNSVLNTINFKVMNEEKEIIIDKKPEEDEKIYIINGKEYDKEIYALGIPIYINGITLGSIVFYSTERFIDKDFGYEILKLISSIYNSVLINEIKKKEIDEKNHKLYFITDHMSSGLKEEMDGYIHLNSKAVEILETYEDQTESEYISKIAPSDAGIYKKTLEEVYVIGVEKEIIYKFKKGDGYISIKERFYPMFEYGTMKIISLIDDVSSFEQTKNTLINLAYNNPISSLPTQVKLFVDLEHLIKEKKFTICLININDFKLYNDLYGYSFGNQLINAFGNIIKEETEDDFSTHVYHLEGDKFVLIYDGINDKRLAVSKTETLMDMITTKANALNKRLKISVGCGVFRYTKNLLVTDPSKILSYASEALIDASEIKDSLNHVALYDQRKSKMRFFESQLITHISECIDHNQMIIYYRQVVNITNNSVYCYVAKLNLVNYEVDDDLIEHVIAKRGLEDLLDKYLIQHTIMELKALYDECRTLIRVVIPVSVKTFNSFGFIDFVLKQIHFFNISSEAIILLPKQPGAKKNICQTFESKGITIASSNIECIYTAISKVYIHKKSQFPDDALDLVLRHTNEKGITVILGDVNSTDDYELAVEQNYQLVYGNYFKKTFRIRNIIDILKK